MAAQPSGVSATYTTTCFIVFMLSGTLGYKLFSFVTASKKFEGTQHHLTLKLLLLIIKTHNHRIIWVVRPLRSSPTINLTLQSQPLNHVMSLSATYTFSDGDSTTSLGSLFQCLITLSVKHFFLTSKLNLPWHNLRLFPLIRSLVTWKKTPTPTSLQFPFRYL